MPLCVLGFVLCLLSSCAVSCSVSLGTLSKSVDVVGSPPIRISASDTRRSFAFAVSKRRYETFSYFSECTRGPPPPPQAIKYGQSTSPLSPPETPSVERNPVCAREPICVRNPICATQTQITSSPSLPDRVRTVELFSSPSRMTANDR